MKVIDISRGLTARLAVWPGDQPFASTWTMRIDTGSTVNLSSVQFSTHAGTHADAPLHFLDEGASISEIPLLQFVGPCLIIDIQQATKITTAHVVINDKSRIPRLLFKTRHSAVSDTHWDPALVPITPSAVDRMAEQDVVLIGTDAPSVDPVESKSLDAHKALARHGIVNLENLSLQDVAPGLYFLVALPLKLPGLEAAPVRAVLLSEAPAQVTHGATH
jgi:arylformamidase